MSENTYQLRIESLAYGGDGIAHLDDGKVVFVRAAAPGDLVAARIRDQKNTIAFADIEEVIEESDSRIEAPCPYVDICGGCQWQHLAYDEQLRWKRQSVVDSLMRIAKLKDANDLVSDCVASGRVLHYRNKIEFGVTRRDGRLDLGLHARKTNGLVSIDSCLLLPKKLIRAPKALRGSLRYLDGSGGIDLDRVALRSSAQTGSTQLALWSSPQSFPRQKAAKVLTDALPLSSLVRVLFKGELKKRNISNIETLSGEERWQESLLDEMYEVSAPSFFQVNTRIAEAMVKHTLELIDVRQGDRILDLYAGVGTFTLPLAAVTDSVTAVESQSASIRDLRRNLEFGGLDAEVIGGDSSRALDSLGPHDHAIVDPPRGGLASDVPAKLAALSLKSLVYVSCDPTTLARDIKALMHEGFELQTLTPFDLFPQTYHVESIAHFVFAS